MEPYILERSEHAISRRDIDPNVIKVLYRLIAAGHVAYLVGGGVRDLLLQRRPKDFDVGTAAHPQQVRDIFRNSRLIGRRFRLVHVFFGPQNIEVATFRRLTEPGEDGEVLIRQDNTFGTPEEDSLRRDFTVNALFYDPKTFRVIDYVGGLADLNSRMIRTVGEPELRMREDPIRMIRAVRFAAKLGFEIEPATRAAIEVHREEILKSSVPRLVEEIFRTFGAPGAERALELMEQMGLLEVILPRLSHFLRASGLPVSATVTFRNLAILSKEIAEGTEVAHGPILACLYLDLALHLRDSSRHPEPQPAAHPARAEHPVRGYFEPHREDQLDLQSELRARGFSRADTERMRLLGDVFWRLLNFNRRTRTLIRKSYFPAAHAFFELFECNYDYDREGLKQLIKEVHSGDHHGAHAHPEHGRGAVNAGGEGAPRKRRRRRRRPRRVDELVNASSNGAAAAHPPHDTAGEDASAQSAPAAAVTRHRPH